MTRPGYGFQFKKLLLISKNLDQARYKYIDSEQWVYVKHYLTRKKLDLRFTFCRVAYEQLYLL